MGPPSQWCVGQCHITKICEMRAIPVDLHENTFCPTIISVILEKSSCSELCLPLPERVHKFLAFAIYLFWLGRYMSSKAFSSLSLVCPFV